MGLYWYVQATLKNSAGKNVHESCSALNINLGSKWPDWYESIDILGMMIQLLTSSPSEQYEYYAEVNGRPLTELENNLIHKVQGRWYGAKIRFLSDQDRGNKESTPIDGDVSLALLAIIHSQNKQMPKFHCIRNGDEEYENVANRIQSHEQGQKRTKLTN